MSTASFVPFLAILLTAVFAASATTCIVLYLPGYCLSDDCNGEGVKNTAVFWATDLFVGGLLTILTLHLTCTTKKGGRIAGSTFLAASIRYIFKGIALLFFGNSGLDDGKGMLGYYILLYSASFMYA